MANIALNNGRAGLVIPVVIRESVEIDEMNIGVNALGPVSRHWEADEDGVFVLPDGTVDADLAAGKSMV